MKRGAGCGAKGCPWDSSWFDDSRRDFYLVEARNGIGAQIGDVVAVEVSDQLLFVAAFFLYLFPLLSVLGVYALLHFLSVPLSYQIGGVLGSIVLVALFLRWYDRHFSPRYQIVELMQVEKYSGCPLLTVGSE